MSGPPPHNAPSFLESLNDSPWLWWPIQLPPKHQPISFGGLFQASLFYTSLPFFISLVAIMGGVYIPTYLLMNGTVPSVMMGASVLLGVWWSIFLALLTIPFVGWNRRARRLQTAMAAQASGQFGLAQFGFPPQQPNNSPTVFNPKKAPQLCHWTGFSETEPVFSWAGLTLVMLGFPVLIMGLSALLLPTVLKGVGYDLTTAQPGLALRPQVMDVAPLDIETTQLNHLALDRRVCCLKYIKNSPFIRGKEAANRTLVDTHGPEKPAPPLAFIIPWSGGTGGMLGTHGSVCSPTGKCVFYEQQRAGHQQLVQLKGATKDKRGITLQYRSLRPDFDMTLESLGNVLATTPQDLPWMDHPSSALTHFNRLLTKFYLLSSKQQLYYLQSEGWHGYQLGNPKHDHWVQVILFNHDQGWLSLNFGLKPGAQESFNQAEIDQILASIEPVQETDIQEDKGPTTLSGDLQNPSDNIDQTAPEEETESND